MSTPTNESLGTSHIDPSKFVFVQTGESSHPIVDKTSEQASHIGNLSHSAGDSTLQKHSYRELTPRASSTDLVLLDEWIATLPPEIQNAHRETIGQRGVTEGTSSESPLEPAVGPPPIPGTMEIPPPIPGTLLAPVEVPNSLLPQGKIQRESDVPGSVNKNDYKTTYLGTQENIDELRGSIQRVDKWVRANPTPLSHAPQRGTKPQLPNDMAMQTRAAQMMAGVQQNREEAAMRKALTEKFDKNNITPLRENKGRLEKEINRLQHDINDMRKRQASEGFQWHLARQRGEVVETKVEKPTLSEKIASKESELASKRDKLLQINDMIRLQNGIRPLVCDKEILSSKKNDLDKKLKVLEQDLKEIKTASEMLERGGHENAAAQAKEAMQSKENEIKQINQQLSSVRTMIASIDMELVKRLKKAGFGEAS